MYFGRSISTCLRSAVHWRRRKSAEAQTSQVASRAVVRSPVPASSDTHRAPLLSAASWARMRSPPSGQRTPGDAKASSCWTFAASRSPRAWAGRHADDAGVDRRRRSDDGHRARATRIAAQRTELDMKVGLRGKRHAGRWDWRSIRSATSRTTRSATSVGAVDEPEVEQAIDVTFVRHAERPPMATVRASASRAARMARWAWWSRERAVPDGMPSVSAISAGL